LTLREENKSTGERQIPAKNRKGKRYQHKNAAVPIQKHREIKGKLPTKQKRGTKRKRKAIWYDVVCVFVVALFSPTRSLGCVRLSLYAV
jgi:hypothetical protein